MENRKVMMLGEKETFLVRVLEGKTTGIGIECSFSSWNVNDINANWEGTVLVVLYMDEGDRPSDEAVHFLKEKLTESGVMMIVIGEKGDVLYIQNRVPGEMIYKTFIRPVDNEEYVKTINEVFSKVKAGEFRKSILIVDDDPNYLGLVREWLKGKYKVSMANSGLQAIKFLGKNKVDLILLDYEMPVTTGPQVLEMLRSEEETRNIPVMFLTGKGDKESVMEVVALKPEGYFLKNIERNDLLDKLEDFFTLHR
ncbi:MAG: response regulator [Butyrivibrio sp.]|nr:response regulator [Butyrivibrio sp.]